MKKIAETIQYTCNGTLRGQRKEQNFKDKMSKNFHKFKTHGS